WRLPNDTKTHLILSKDARISTSSESLEDLPPGFVISPFDTTRDRVFLQADHSFSFGDGQLNLPVTPSEIASNLWLTDLLRQVDSVPNPTSYVNNATATGDTDQDFFLRLVSNALHEINQATFEKVVVSRTKVVDMPEDFSIAQSFEKLCNLYSNALISFVTIPTLGTWMGASPEVLISVEDKKIFKTTALAG